MNLNKEVADHLRAKDLRRYVECEKCLLSVLAQRREKQSDNVVYGGTPRSLKVFSNGRYYDHCGVRHVGDSVAEIVAMEITVLDVGRSSHDNGNAP